MSEGTAIAVLQHMQLESVEDDTHDLASVQYGFELARQIALGAIQGNATPQPATDTPEAGAWQEQVMVSVACKTSDCGCIQYDGLILYTNQPPPFHDGCTCYTIKTKVLPAFVQAWEVRDTTIINDVYYHKICDVGLTGDPIALARTKNAANQIAGLPDLLTENTRLCAELAMVVAARKETDGAWSAAASQRDELLVENAEHKAYTASLRAAPAAEREAHKETKRHANMLYNAFETSAEYRHKHELEHSGAFVECGGCSFEVRSLAAHDAWRASEGGGA